MQSNSYPALLCGFLSVGDSRHAWPPIKILPIKILPLPGTSKIQAGLRCGGLTYAYTAPRMPVMTMRVSLGEPTPHKSDCSGVLPRGVISLWDLPGAAAQELHVNAKKRPTQHLTEGANNMRIV